MVTAGQCKLQKSRRLWLVHERNSLHSGEWCSKNALQLYSAEHAPLSWLLVGWQWDRFQERPWCEDSQDAITDITCIYDWCWVVSTTVVETCLRVFLCGFVTHCLNLLNNYLWVRAEQQRQLLLSNEAKYVVVKKKKENPNNNHINIHSWTASMLFFCNKMSFNSQVCYK